LEPDIASGGLAGQIEANPVRTGEGKTAQGGMTDQGWPDGGTGPEHEVEDTSGKREVDQPTEQMDGRSGGQLGRLENDGVAEGQGGDRLADDRGEGKVPRRDKEEGTDRLMDQLMTLSRGTASRSAQGRSGLPEEVSGVGQSGVDLGLRLAEGLAVLPGDEGGEVKTVPVEIEEEGLQQAQSETG
jgi:hypothetical protein